MWLLTIKNVILGMETKKPMFKIARGQGDQNIEVCVLVDRSVAAIVRDQTSSQSHNHNLRDELEGGLGWSLCPSSPAISCQAPLIMSDSGCNCRASSAANLLCRHFALNEPCYWRHFRQHFTFKEYSGRLNIRQDMFPMQHPTQSVGFSKLYIFLAH